ARPGVLGARFAVGDVVGRHGPAGRLARGFLLCYDSRSRWSLTSTGARGPPVTPATSLPQYYIANGVHRAVAARENHLTLVPDRMVAHGQPHRIVYVHPDQLHSPKATISRTVTARRNYPALEQAMSTAVGRARVPPIEIQPLGETGQSTSVPLAQVQILP